MSTLEEALVGGAAYRRRRRIRCRRRRWTWRRRPTRCCSAPSAAPSGSRSTSRVRPEKGLLGLRAGLELFANLRPAIVYPQLAEASTLKPEVVAGPGYHDRARAHRRHLLRPAARHRDPAQTASARASTRWSTPSPRSSASAGSPSSWPRKRGNRVCSVDKANVLECTELWREVVDRASAATIRTSSSATCMSTTRPCSWCARPSSST